MESWDQFGVTYDQKLYGGTAKKYLIASTQRSGSHYLCYLLFKSGDMGSPLEYLNPIRQENWRVVLHTESWASTFEQQIKKRTSESGWFGLKAHWHQFENVLSEPLMSHLLHFERYIHIKRNNLVEQAVSLVIAEQTKAWISHFQAQVTPTYCGASIKRALMFLIQENEAWANFFLEKRISPLVVVYEDLCLHPEEVISSVRHYLGVQVSATKFNYEGPKKQATELNKEWVKKFKQEFG